MFEGRVVLITGAASGIGAATAHVFALRGAKVVIADVNAKLARQVEVGIRDAGGEAFVVEVDVRHEPSVQRMIEACLDHFGALNIAVNNAGIMGLPAPIRECSEVNWDRVMSVNLKGVFLCLKYELAHMSCAGGGAIVNTASVAGLVACDDQLPAYGASKHGVVGLTKIAALEHARDGIRVNAVCPGEIDTPMQDAFGAALTSEERREVDYGPSGRIGTAEEVAEAIAWLCSPAAAYVNGHALPVDGGYVAR